MEKPNLPGAKDDEGGTSRPLRPQVSNFIHTCASKKRPFFAVITGYPHGNRGPQANLTVSDAGEAHSSITLPRAPAASDWIKVMATTVTREKGERCGQIRPTAGKKEEWRCSVKFLHDLWLLSPSRGTSRGSYFLFLLLFLSFFKLTLIQLIFTRIRLTLSELRVRSCYCQDAFPRTC